MVDVCLQAAEILAARGIEAEVIDLCALRPLDFETIRVSIEKTHALISVEGGWPQCGIGAEILARIHEEAFDEMDAPPVRITGVDVPLAYAANLEALSFPQVQHVCSQLRCDCSALRGGVRGGVCECDTCCWRRPTWCESCRAFAHAGVFAHFGLVGLLQSVGLKEHHLQNLFHFQN